MDFQFLCRNVRTLGIIDFDCVAMSEKLIAAAPESAAALEASGFLMQGMKKLYPDVYTVSGTSTDWDFPARDCWSVSASFHWKPLLCSNGLM